MRRLHRHERQVLRTAARRRSRNIHVSSDRGPVRWKVTCGGRALSYHRTQANALRHAIREAKRSRVDVVTHGRNGQIRSKDSYGNETRIRDTEH